MPASVSWASPVRLAAAAVFDGDGIQHRFPGVSILLLSAAKDISCTWLIYPAACSGHESIAVASCQQEVQAGFRMRIDASAMCSGACAYEGL
jgi:hypothetical protein